MKKLLFIFILLAACAQGAWANNDSLLTELSKAIRQTASYDEARLKEIDQLRQSLHAPGQPLAVLFDRHEKIYEAYKIFNYDSAYGYAIRLVKIAREMNNASYRVAAQIKLSFILLSTGLYKETGDSLASLASQPIPDSLKGEYYTLWGRYYYDLAGYANDHYHSVDYDIKGNKYLDSALAFYIPGSFEHIYYSGLKYFKKGNKKEAATFFDQLMVKPDLGYHQLALTASTLSAIYLQNGDIDKAIDLLVQATVADIKTCTKETVAIFHLAELLYKKGDLRHAAMCIESAIANAEFYGARQRKVQASSILPLIESERINGIEAQKSLLAKYAIVVTILVLALVVLTWIILRQVKKLKLTQQALTAANAAQHVINQQLQESNSRLEEVNEKLQEANKIKEEYIGYFFNMDSEFYNKLDKIKTTIEQKLQERRYEDIKFFLNKIDARKEKEELLLSFDKIFLKLFPNFVQEVNALLRQEEKIGLRDGELLNTDLRIFALMRMGVADPEKIARILEYSVKTIYSYKSRIKNKALIPGDEFEDRIMQIKTL
ncbi:tetratricopeptide repeat protein [Paraflavitalea soli]|uniref:Tetratricopeptide repeat protein n=1 Tax=Paraflavitalea soli TaxID=2315862 RepID=A0A3B7MUB4_9BACT|nr:DUF6377 domain-containing protein [Paraflavitalea soli]AXY76839.1 tetratricopeptide repeat protein [Paraflavitalea soli]